MKKFLLITFILAAVLVAVFFAKQKTGREIANENNPVSSSSEIIKVAYLPKLDQMKFYLDYIEESGSLEKNNIILEKIPVDRGTDNLVLAGGADLRLGLLPGTLALYLEGQETRWVDSLFNSVNNLGVSRYPKEEVSSIKTAALTSFGGNPEILITQALKGLGADLGSVEYIAVPSNVGKKEFLDRGRVDFTVLGSRDFIEETGIDEDYYIFETSEIYDKEANMFYVITSSKEALERNGEAIEKFISSSRKALDKIKTEREEVISFLLNKYDYSQEKAEIFYNEFSRAIDDTRPPSVEVAEEMRVQFQASFDSENSNRDVSNFVVSY
ncbi:hypothetical protein C0584_02665 [Candidatus Parcubacteria bacterium]|nr:MAG: hypothetical protein C0584_02665 [Candidatus Parcubacteria bacterium]